MTRRRGRDGRGDALLHPPGALFGAPSLGDARGRPLLFVASLMSTKLLPSGFIPAADVSRSLLAIELPPGSRLEDTDKVTRDIAERLKAIPEVRSVLIYGGVVLGGASEVRRSYARHQLRSQGQARPHPARFADQDRARSARHSRHPLLVSQGQWSARYLADHRRRRFEDDRRHGEPARERNARDSLHRESNVDGRARPAGAAHHAEAATRCRSRRLDRGAVGTIRVATLGDIDANLAKFDAGDRLVPIRVELDQHARADLGLLQALRVSTGSGGAVPLSAVADFDMSRGPTAINRYDRARRVTIEGDLAGQTRSARRSTPSMRYRPRRRCRRASRSGNRAMSR